MGRRSALIAIVATMAIGSVAMWVVTPFAWIYAASRIGGSSQIQMPQVAMILVGIPATMALLGGGLSALNSLYGRVSGQAHPVRVVAPWRRSLRDSRDGGRPTTVLDVVMVCSVLAALAAMGLWFLLLARGGGLPG